MTRSIPFTLCVLTFAPIALAQPVRLGRPNSDGKGFHGWSVAGIPDVTGDGRGEIAVGAIGARSLGTYAGLVQMYSGGSGVHYRTLHSPDREHHGRFGWAVSQVPDVNGDGWADVAVGAPREEPEGWEDDCGRAYLYSGRTGQLLRKLFAPGNSEHGWFGCAVAGCADLNGDGRGEVIVGAHRDDPGNVPADAGRVYIFSGATGARLRTLISPNQDEEEQFGYSVAQVGDVNGDGRVDILVGAPQMLTDDTVRVPFIESSVGKGRAYLFSGASGQVLRAFYGQELHGGFGRSVAGVPDLNGDGRPDLIIGAPFQDPGGSPENAGRVYVYSGATGAYLRTLVPPKPKSDGLFGCSVAGLRDMSGDGRGDIVVGGRHEADSGAGRAHVFSGATGVRVRTLLPQNDPNFPQDGFGSFVAAVPDAHGRPEIAVGAPFEEWIPDGFLQWDYEGCAYLFRN